MHVITNSLTNAYHLKFKQMKNMNDSHGKTVVIYFFKTLLFVYAKCNKKEWWTLNHSFIVLFNLAKLLTLLCISSTNL